MRVAFVPDNGDYEIVEGQGERRALRYEMMCMLDLSGIKGMPARELQSGKSSKGGYSSKDSKAVSADLY